MIEYLGNQAYKQRGIASDLKASMYKANENNSKNSSHMGSIDAALAANKLVVNRLKKENALLEDQMVKIKVSTTNLRLLLKDMQNSHNLGEKMHQEELIVMRGSYLQGIDALKRDLRSANQKHAAEILTLKHQLSVSKEVHQEEVLKLKEEMRLSEVSHGEELASMLSALSNVVQAEVKKKSEEEELAELKYRILAITKSNSMAANELRSLLGESCPETAVHTITKLEGI